MGKVVLVRLPIGKRLREHSMQLRQFALIRVLLLALLSLGRRKIKQQAAQSNHQSSGSNNTDFCHWIASSPFWAFRAAASIHHSGRDARAPTLLHTLTGCTKVMESLERLKGNWLPIVSVPRVVSQFDVEAASRCPPRRRR